jgi:hypothetical protein
MLASLASLAYFRKMPFWRVRVHAKSAEILESIAITKLVREVPLLSFFLQLTFQPTTALYFVLSVLENSNLGLFSICL